jgi:hypothetical protein
LVVSGSATALVASKPMVEMRLSPSFVIRKSPVRMASPERL